MPESWLLVLWLVLPGDSVTREIVSGFESKRECTDYGIRYRAIEFRWGVEFLCQENAHRDTARRLTSPRKNRDEAQPAADS
jgi:hypothetical protein